MLHAVLVLLGLASVIVAVLVMFQVVSIKDLLSFSRRGLVALLVLLVAGCLIKQLVVAVVVPMLVPATKMSLMLSALTLLVVLLLALATRVLLNRGERHRNS